MKYSSFIIAAILSLSTLVYKTLAQKFSDQTGNVVINNYRLSPQDIEQIKKIYGDDPISGTYWYDTRSGAFGIEGGPAIGVMYPGHKFGTLAADASRGTSGVFINGRELQNKEAYQMARLFGYPAPIPGRYWLNANGDLGMEGYFVSLGNVYYIISQSFHRQSAGGSNIWSRGLYSAGNYYTGANGQPTQGYVSVPGYGPVSHGM